VQYNIQQRRFESQSCKFYIEGEVRDMETIRINNEEHIIVSKNNNNVEVYKIVNNKKN
jgi:intein-encoded DNA endonuclease-like protein